MKKKSKKISYISFERYLAQQMKNKAFRRAYEEEGRRLGIAYKILQLRKHVVVAYSLIYLEPTKNTRTAKNTRTVLVN